MYLQFTFTGYKGQMYVCLKGNSIPIILFSSTPVGAIFDAVQLVSVAESFVSCRKIIII